MTMAALPGLYVGTINGWAHLSPCERYRYVLGRRWAPGRHVCWIMLNPSRADAVRDDATLTRCIGYSRSYGFKALVVVNLYAWRATDPRELATVDDPEGPDNNRIVLEQAAAAHTVIAAWGANRMARQLEPAWLSALSAAHITLHRVGPPTKDGHPPHPLRLDGDLPLELHRRGEPF